MSHPHGHHHHPAQPVHGAYPAGAMVQQQVIVMAPTGANGAVTTTLATVGRPLPQSSDWNYSLCSIFEAPCTAIRGAYCPCDVYAENVQNRDGRDVYCEAVFLCCFCTPCFYCCTLPIDRTRTREVYGIRGNECGDFCTAVCCRPCALTQESLEIQKRGRALGPQQQVMFVQASPQPAGASAPTAVMMQPMPPAAQYQYQQQQQQQFQQQPYMQQMPMGPPPPYAPAPAGMGSAAAMSTSDHGMGTVVAMPMDGTNDPYNPVKPSAPPAYDM